MAALENGSLEVVDLETGVRIKSISELDRPQGVAIASSIGCAVVACGGGKVYAYDTKTLNEVKSFKLGAGADNVRYDATHDTVLVSYGNNEKGAVAVIDPHSWNVLSEFSFPSRPESFQLDLTGNRMFANLPRGVRAVTDGEVAVLDLKSGKALARIPLRGQARNFPMAFDSTHQRLYIASRRPASLIQIDMAIPAKVNPVQRQNSDLMGIRIRNGSKKIGLIFKFFISQTTLIFYKTSTFFMSSISVQFLHRN